MEVLVSTSESTAYLGWSDRSSSSRCLQSDVLTGFSFSLGHGSGSMPLPHVSHRFRARLKGERFAAFLHETKL